MRNFLRLSTIVALCALLAALSACQSDSEAKRNAELATAISELRLSGTLGFICKGNDSTIVCTCRKDAPITSAMTCAGMKQACEKLGKEMKCPAGKTYCDCGG